MQRKRSKERRERERGERGHLVFQLCPSVQGWVGGCHPSPNAVTRSDRQRAEEGAILIGNQHHRSRSKTRAQSRAGAPGLQPFTSVNPGPHLLGTESAGRKCASNCPPGPDKPRQRSAGGIPREPGVSARGDPATVPRGPQPADVPLDPRHTTPLRRKSSGPHPSLSSSSSVSPVRCPSDPPAVAPPQAAAAPYKRDDAGRGLGVRSLFEPQGRRTSVVQSWPRL
ncbi:hypothetical protein OPV22_021870 [Ensete ventricosum]|uniref:Uncharacterized protein n=1 Tax=Ensete ventricosum TaxID=4639 RepID=A0AAV8QM76_ENSVE|nr:hypothetical protein OPV22_021870 [Ensete ventricosum]